MNQLDKLRDEKAEEWENTADQYNETFLFKTGWDAHEALNLPVLFTRFIKKNFYLSKGKYRHKGDFYKNGNLQNEEQIYDYWINNIYKPE